MSVFMLCSFQTFDLLKLPDIYETLIVKLLAAADKYYLNRLRLLCESHICKGVSVKSVAKILALAHIYKATELKSVCLKLTAENLAGMLLILRLGLDNLA